MNSDKIRNLLITIEHRSPNDVVGLAMDRSAMLDALQCVVDWCSWYENADDNSDWMLGKSALAQDILVDLSKLAQINP